MALPAGTKIGVYEIVGPLGAGGMGEVYRARDTRLRREVAIKVLPPSLSGDPEHLARFAREARLLASLNHPHIATIHGLEDADGVHALVLELVEGPTLAERLLAAKSGLPLTDVLKIAGQIAEAIEAAHDKGIVHRDLKPANIKLGADGHVKVLDFGIAKALSSASEAGDLQQTVTATEAMPGKVIGTPAYMSPEQARGQTVDRRTDIWAFGCVLYEMLAGRLVFPGETTSDRIAAVLERQPDWEALPAQTPAAIRRLLRRCLEKDLNRRLHDIADARIELDDARDERSEGTAATPRMSSRWRAASLVVITALLAAAMGALWFRPAASPHEVRLEITTPLTVDPSIAVSPDGLKVAFVALREGRPQLWLRMFDSAAAQPLPGTETASNPFWSPDSKTIGFFSELGIKRVDIDGGSMKSLTGENTVPNGATWNRDGVILFANSPGGVIFRTSADGAEPKAITELKVPEQRGHTEPQFLPDGQHFLFEVTGTSDASGVYVGRLDSPETKRLFAADTYAVYSAGHLFFVREGQLLAQRFDPGKLETVGSPVPVADHVSAHTYLSASQTGAVVHRTGALDSGRRQFVWVDRTGRELNKVVYPDNSALGPALSPDGSHLAVYRYANGNMDLWTYDLHRQAWERATFDPGDDIFPLWSRDGGRLIFAGIRSRVGQGTLSLFETTLNDPKQGERLVLTTPYGAFPMDLSSDGRFLLYDTHVPGKGTDIWALPLGGDRKPIELVATDFNEAEGQFSPDGKWVAYQSNRTGRPEIYLRPFPGPGADVRVSTEGGTQARWKPDGRELFFVAQDDRLTSAPMKFSADAKAVEIGTPVPLFATNIGSTARFVFRQQYVVSPDGQSFIMQSILGDGNASPIQVILNWNPGR